MADIWLPGYERWELPGVPGQPYDENDDPKALLHSTEGSGIDGAVSAYRSYPPHVCVHYATRRKVQHIPINRAAYALWNGDADDSRCIQVEIVGFASQMHLLSDDELRWLGEEVARPLHEYGGVPYVVVWKGFRRDGEMPYALASPSSPLRLTQAELDSFSGFLGHQHIPGDGHWDPGGLNVPRILAFAQNLEDDVSAKDMWAWEGLSYYDLMTEKIVPGRYTSAAELLRKAQMYSEKSWWYAIDNRNMLLKLAGKPEVTAEEIAAEIRPGLAATLLSGLSLVVREAIEENDGVELSEEAAEALATDILKKMGGALQEATTAEPQPSS